MASRNRASYGELINHIGFVRYRINGSGALKSTLYSLDDALSVDLANLTMATATNREPTVLSNFKQQRASLEFSVEQIDEYFKIQRIIIGLKPVATSYPQ